MGRNATVVDDGTVIIDTKKTIYDLTSTSGPLLVGDTGYVTAKRGEESNQFAFHSRGGRIANVNRRDDWDPAQGVVGQ